MIQLEIKPAKHLISAYNQMMAEMRDIFDQDKQQGEQSDITLQKILDMAKHQVVHAGKASAEEAHEIGEYIKRDVNDAAEYMMESSTEFHDWLMLDIELIERRVIELFLSVADYTRIELEQFKQKPPVSEQAPTYKGGEITDSDT